MTRSSDGHGGIARDDDDSLCGDRSDSNTGRRSTTDEVVDGAGIDTKVRGSCEVEVVAQLRGVRSVCEVVTELETIHCSRKVTK